MKSWRLDQLGGAFALQEIDQPEPGPGALRLRVAAAALNFADLLMREGKYQEKPPLPYTPGMEVAGVVEALGPGSAAPPPAPGFWPFSTMGLWPNRRLPRRTASWPSLMP